MGRKKNIEHNSDEINNFTFEQIEKAIKKLGRRIQDLQNLNPAIIKYDDAIIDNIERDIRDTIREIFGPGSPEFNDNRSHRIWHGGYNVLDSEDKLQEKFATGIPQSIKTLQGLIKRLEEKREDSLDIGTNRMSVGAIPRNDTNRVFIVHGHDQLIKEKVARFVGKFGLTPIILHEQPNEGNTLIEKFEKHSDVSYAIILLTPDDIGYAKGNPKQLKYRARQNVIFELGYFIGSLGRAFVCALYSNEVELPSDYNGMVYIKYDSGLEWQLSLAKELKQAGFEIDMNKL